LQLVFAFSGFLPLLSVPVVHDVKKVEENEDLSALNPEHKLTIS